MKILPSEKHLLYGMKQIQTIQMQHYTATLLLQAHLCSWPQYHSTSYLINLVNLNTRHSPDHHEHSYSLGSLWKGTTLL